MGGHWVTDWSEQNLTRCKQDNFFSSFRSFAILAFPFRIAALQAAVQRVASCQNAPAVDQNHMLMAQGPRLFISPSMTHLQPRLQVNSTTSSLAGPLSTIIATPMAVHCGQHIMSLPVHRLLTGEPVVAFWARDCKPLHH